MHDCGIIHSCCSTRIHLLISDGAGSNPAGVVSFGIFSAWFGLVVLVGVSKLTVANEKCMLVKFTVVYGIPQTN